MMEERKFKSLEYLLDFPEDYKGGKLPIILHIHGAGGRGNDIGILKDHSVFNYKKESKDNRFIIAAPQCHADTWFELFPELMEFADMIRHEEYADIKRVYLMGASMGGYTIWQLAMSRPEWFAAIVPICGGGMYWNAPRLRSVPVWAHHGMLDPVVNVEESIKMVNAVNRAGGNAKLTVYENVQHDSWVPAFANPEVYDWLLSHSK